MKYEQKLLIITSDERVLSWKTLPIKLAYMERYINKGKNANFSIEVVHQKVIPAITPEGRISHTWLADLFTPYFSKGYDIIGFHFTGEQRLSWNFNLGLRGANPRTQNENEFGDFYFWADENTQREEHNQFMQTCMHELMHEYFQHTGLPDQTHEWHQSDSNIGKRFAELDWSLYQPERFRLKYTVSILQRIKEKWERVAYFTKRLEHPDTLQPLVERKANELIEIMSKKGHRIRVVEGHRSYERQNQLYAQGRTTPGVIVTNARGGESMHNFGVAVDFVFRDYGYEAPKRLWNLLGEEGKKLGFEWGGDWTTFVDKPHFEMTLGYTLLDFQDGKVDYYLFK